MDFSPFNESITSPHQGRSIRKMPPFNSDIIALRRNENSPIVSIFPSTHFLARIS